VEAAMNHPGVIVITTTGITPVVVSEEEAHKVKALGVTASDFRVGVRVNKQNNRFEAVFLLDNDFRLEAHISNVFNDPF